MKHWWDKFANALRGLWFGIAGQSSFAVHLACAGMVVCLAWWLHCSLWEWSLLLLCIGWVLSLELVNSAVENLARGLCSEKNLHVGRALDIAASAVLCASGMAVVIGLLVLGPKLYRWFAP